MAQFFDKAISRPLLLLVPAWVHPNHLSVLRAALLWPLIEVQHQPRLAVGVIIASSICDLLDGSLARIRNQTSRFGEILDAASDKIFVLGALIFTCWELVPASIIWSILLLDLMLIAGRPIKSRLGVTSKSNAWGALKVWTQTIAIGLVLLREQTLVAFANVVFFLAIIFAFCSLVGHVRDILRRKQS